MSTILRPSFCTLPIELVHYIFRYLEAQTIVRSLRSVCKRFYTIVKTYNQFKLDFSSISKVDFLFLCNFISPENIQSLTLSDRDDTPGQIQYFMSFIRVNQFTRLRCLNLIEIDECHLNIVLKDLQTLPLQSLYIYSKQDYSQGIINSYQLSSVISLSSLDKLSINIPTFNLSTIQWPPECRIQSLEIYCRTLDEYCTIVNCLPYLRKLVVIQLNQYNSDETTLKLSNLKSFRQLSSLTFQHCLFDMFLLESLLSLTPTIEHLRLIRSLDLHAFVSNLHQWVDFIETNLPLLMRFDFFLTNDQTHFNFSANEELLIAPFRTPFWTITKRWFVICDYIICPRTIILYTSSFFDPEFECFYESKGIRRTTSTPSINTAVKMDGLRKLHLDLTKIMPLAASPQSVLPRTIPFPQLDELTLYMGCDWSLGSLRVISTLVDVSHLTKISLILNHSFNNDTKWTENIYTLLKLGHNIRSLAIVMSNYYLPVDDSIIEICSLVPNYVKQLTIAVSSVSQMHRALHYLKYKSSVKFQYTNTTYCTSDMHLAWFDQEQRYDTFRLDNSSLCIWFDRCDNASSQNGMVH